MHSIEEMQDKFYSSPTYSLPSMSFVVAHHMYIQGNRFVYSEGVRIFYNVIAL